MMRIVLSISLLFITNVVFGDDAPARNALFVGVTKYAHAEMNQPQLEFPEADAKGVGEVFKQSGYEVDFLFGKNATQEAIRKKLGGTPREIRR